MSGFEKQTYTQVPNSLFEIMGDMDECELKVVLYICRYTFGYHRDSVKISTRKLAEAIGMNTASVQKGAEAAEKRGLIERINEGQNTTEWRAVVEGVSESDTVVYQNLNHPVSEFESQVGLNKVKEIKEINTQSQKIIKSANQMVDAILENEKKAAGRQWSKLPEMYHPYAKAFQDATGIVFTKQQAFDWMSTIDEWCTAGYQPIDVTNAINAMKQEGKMSFVSRPGSVTWKLRAMTAQNTTAQAKQAFDPFASLNAYLAQTGD